MTLYLSLVLKLSGLNLVAEFNHIYLYHMTAVIIKINQISKLKNYFLIPIIMKLII